MKPITTNLLSTSSVPWKMITLQGIAYDISLDVTTLWSSKETSCSQKERKEPAKLAIDNIYQIISENMIFFFNWCLENPTYRC